MSQLNDPIRNGLTRGWRVSGGAFGPIPATLVCDVVIVGSGAGTGVRAELLTKSGLQVIPAEEGPPKNSRDFNQREAEAYPALYQESAAHKTDHKAANILQGRCVGGSTTVGWTRFFRTPPPTLQFWRDELGLADDGSKALGPCFEQAERPLKIAAWQAPPTERSELLRRRTTQLGVAAAIIVRNVKRCWNLGSCGLGCPTNAKQSMPVTTIPAALDAGAQLLTDELRAEQFDHAKGRVTGLVCRAVLPNGTLAGPADDTVRITAKHSVLAGGAINSPAVLLHSSAPDPHGQLGGQTFLHPVVMSSSVFPQKVEAWRGAPKSGYCGRFLHGHPVDGLAAEPMGYKLEAPPLHPLIFACMVPGFGQQQHSLSPSSPHNHTPLGLRRDAFQNPQAARSNFVTTDPLRSTTHARTMCSRARGRRWCR